MKKNIFSVSSHWGDYNNRLRSLKSLRRLFLMWTSNRSKRSKVIAFSKHLSKQIHQK